MPKFKVGDRVRCIAAQDGNDFIVGQKGTVCSITSSLNTIAVEFDNDVKGHSLGYPLKYAKGHGWHVDASKLELLCEPKVEHDLKIIIYHQGNRTIAKYVVDKRVATEDCATCRSEDTFSFLIGAQIALARLAQQYDAKPVLTKEALDKALENIEII